MIVLLDANPASVAMISSFRDFIFADKAYFFDGSFALLNEQGPHIPWFVGGTVAEQGEVEAEEDSHEGNLRVEDVILSKLKEDVYDE